MKNRTVTHKRSDKKSNSKLKKILLLEFAILIIYYIISLIVCTLLFTVDIPIGAVYYIILISLALSAFLSGYITGVKMKKNGLISGVIYNLFMVVLTLLISLLLNGFSFDYRMFVTLVVMLAMSAAGGITAVNSKRKLK